MKSSSIFFYEGYVGIAPTIINLSKMLNKQKRLITIYGMQTNYPDPGKLGDCVNTVYFRKYNKVYNYLRAKGFKNSVLILELLSYLLPCLFVEIKKQIQAPKQKSLNIGVDIYGSIAALISFYLFKRKFLILSLELHEPSRFKGIASFIGKLAKLAYEKSEGLLIQDEDRFKTFCQYYQYQHEQVFYLPNSPIAEDNSTQNLQSDKNFFREKFNLTQEQYPCLLVQAGMICNAVYSKELAQTFTHIDNGSALIFHDRGQRKEDPYIKSLREINSTNLFLSLEPVPFDRIDEIFSSATIGLAFYADLGNNFSQISMASGKLPQYLKHGKPILVNALPSLSRLIEQYQIGFAIKDPTNSEEIKLAIQTILSDYDRYSKNARFCFEQEFDFAKKIEPLLSYVEQKSC
jgi:glycosyltransferase involved in cell wall biosynthesis